MVDALQFSGLGLAVLGVFLAVFALLGLVFATGVALLSAGGVLWLVGRELDRKGGRT